MSKLNPDFLADAILNDTSLDEISGGHNCLPPTPTNLVFPTISNLTQDDHTHHTDWIPGACYGSGN